IRPQTPRTHTKIYLWIKSFTHHGTLRWNSKKPRTHTKIIQWEKTFTYHGTPRYDSKNPRTHTFGNGITATNLRYMRMFYLTFPIYHSLSDKLSWTHYRMLTKVSNSKAPQN
ncbi:MAG: hypothetical protein K2J74_03595, partial [Muribaculaceae bacterium]|nr:hypothetical protein [Muribaculaceae bacterium]